MIAIAAVDENFAIGKDNRLLARIPEDLKRFSALTTGNTVVMGRKTYLSLPNPPLPNRETILLTGTPERFPQVRCARDLKELFLVLEDVKGEVFVCGGETVYRELLPYCEKAALTKIRYKFSGDSWFPDIDREVDWETVWESEYFQAGGYEIKYVDYKNRRVLKMP